MSWRHFINDSSVLLNSALQSITYTNPSVALDAENKVIYRRPEHGKQTQVSIISGGGSGHEPSFSSMVGSGLLSAAVAGTIFASPNAEQVRKAMSRVDTDKGVLVIVMNYTGDILNFGMAVEKAKAAGISCEQLVVADDVGVGREKSGKVGRRGIAGTCLVQKIAGALAAQGSSLDQVYKVAKLVADNLVSVGASLDHVHVPGRALPDPKSKETLSAHEVEIGMGIHNEPGSERAKVELPELVTKMLSQLLDPKDSDRAFVNVNSNEVVLLVNNLGGVSVLELGGITAEVVKQLSEQWGIRPVRILSGTYMTSLNGLGFSISLLNVVNTDIGGPSMIQLLDHPCEACGWSAPISKNTWESKNEAISQENASIEQEVQSSGLRINADAMTEALVAGLQAVIAAEPEVTRYDTVVGDGDCGIGLKRGAEGVLKHLSENPLTGDVVVDLDKIVSVVETTMDGTSGALYAIFLNSLVHALKKAEPGNITSKTWAGAMKQSCEDLAKYTPARPGDRTLVDALYPFVETLATTLDVKKAAEASNNAAEATKGMKANLGRTVYVGGTGYEEVPDPGAWGLGQFLLGLAGLKEDGWEAV